MFLGNSDPACHPACRAVASSVESNVIVHPVPKVDRVKIVIAVILVEEESGATLLRDEAEPRKHANDCTVKRHVAIEEQEQDK